MTPTVAWQPRIATVAIAFLFLPAMAPPTAASGAWATNGQIYSPPDTLFGINAATDGTYVYALGGRHYWSSAPDTYIQRYDPATDTVTVDSAVLPSPRDAGCSVYGFGKVYLFGGWTSTTSATNQIVAYDPVAHTATVVATLPTTQYGCSAVWTGSVAYIFGGIQNQGCGGTCLLNTILKFDPLTNTVTNTGDVLPTKRHATSAVWDGSKAYIFGGSDLGNLNDIIKYDPAAHTVTKATAVLPTARHWTSAAYDGRYAYVFAGAHGIAGGYTVYDDILRYDPLDSTAAALTTLSTRLPYPTMASDAAWVGNTAYILGGTGQSWIVAFSPFAPDAVTNLVAQTGLALGTIDLTWNPGTAPAGYPVLSYNVYRAIASGGPYSLVGNAAATHYTDSGLEAAPYYYVVRAVNSVGPGPNSNEANAMALGTPPGPDGYTPAKYRTESSTGNTPFAGVVVKQPFPGPSAPTVNLASGEMVATFTLLHLTEGEGHNFDFTATFRSMGNEAGNPLLTARWDANWLQYLEASGPNYLHHTGDGKIQTYTPSGSVFIGPPGTYTTISTLPSGKMELQDRHGNRRDFDPAQGLKLSDTFDTAGNHWTITHTTGTSTLTDPTGRTFTLTHTAIPGTTHSSLTSIADPAGRTTYLDYEPVTGRLTSIRAQAATSGATAMTRFFYNDANRITAIRDPDGTDYLRINYDAFGRVRSQLESIGPGFFFNYYHDAGITHAWDGAGNKVEWNFLPTGAAERLTVPAAKTEYTRMLRTGDPPSYRTAFSYNSQEELATITHPLLNSARYQYNDAATNVHAKGNLLSITLNPPTPASASHPLQSTAQLSIATTFNSYQATCNQPTMVTDPRGSVTRYYYDVDEVGGTDHNADGLFGATAQKACNVVRVEHPTTNSPGTGFPSLSPVETFTYDSAGRLLTHKDANGVVEARKYYSATAPGQPKGYLEHVTQDSTNLGHSPWRTTYEYTTWGAVNKVTDANNHATQYDVDLRGRTTKTTGPDLGGGTFAHTLYSYDSDDNTKTVRQEKMPGAGTCPPGACTLREYAYDSMGRLTGETTHPTSTHSIATTYAYDGNNRLTQRKGGMLEVQTTTYDERGLPLTRSGPDGGSFAYDANGNLATFTDQLGHATTYQYDGYDRLAVKTLPNPVGTGAGARFITSHDANSNVVQAHALAPTGNLLAARKSTYNEANQAYQVQDWMQDASATGPAVPPSSISATTKWVTTQRQFDALGRVLAERDDNLHVTTMTYDGRGAVSTVTDAMPTGATTTTYTPDLVGNVLSVTTSTAAAAGTSCPCTYATMYAYDAMNRVYLVTNPDSTDKDFEYDARGNVRKVTDENGHETLYTFDDADRPTVTQRSLATTPVTYLTTTTVWDDEGRIGQQCDDLGACTTTTFVPATSLPSTVTPPIGSQQPAITYTRNAAGLPTQIKHSSGATTLQTIVLGYDALNRVCTVDLQTASTGCPSGSSPPNVAAAASQQGIGTTHQDFVYDHLGRITLATDNGVSNLAATAASPDIVTGMADLRASQSYDTMGHLLSETQTWNAAATVAAPAGPLRTTYTVDGLGNVLTMQYPQPSTATSATPTRLVTRTYDANERLSSVLDNKGATPFTTPTSLITHYTYEGGAVKEKAFGGPAASLSPVAKSVVTYDAAHRPGAIVHSRVTGPTSTALLSFTTTYDGVGNRIAQQLQGPIAPPPANDVYSQLYHLDAADRLDCWKQGPINPASLPTCSTSTPTNTWNLAPTNDWNSQTTGSTTCTRVPTTPTGSAVRAVSETCGTSPPVVYQWDALGNLVSDGTHTYKWDFMNRLIRVNDNTGNLVVGYAYDAFGRRISKVFPSHVAGSSLNENSLYAYSGQHVIQEDQLKGGTVLPPSLSAPPAFRVVRQWVYGSGMDEVLAMDWDRDGDQSTIGSTDARYYYAYDSAGNVAGLFSEDGHIQEGYVYDAYGNPKVLCTATPGADLKWDGTDNFGSFDPVTRIASCGAATTNPPFGPSGNVWFFTGRQYDPEAGLYNYRARHYHPALGQFMSMDPVGAWGDPNNLGNPYAYVGNNPGSRRDPTGMYGVDEFIGEVTTGMEITGNFLVYGVGGSVVTLGTEGIGQACGFVGATGCQEWAAGEVDYNLDAIQSEMNPGGTCLYTDNVWCNPQCVGQSLSCDFGAAIDDCMSPQNAATRIVCIGVGAAVATVVALGGYVAAPYLASAATAVGGSTAARAVVGCGLGLGFEGVSSGFQGSAMGYAGSCAGGALALGLPGRAPTWAGRVGLGLRNGFFGGAADTLLTQGGNYALSGGRCFIDGSAAAYTMGAYTVGGGLGGAAIPREMLAEPHLVQGLYDSHVSAVLGGYGLFGEAVLHGRLQAGSCAA